MELDLRERESGLAQCRNSASALLCSARSLSLSLSSRAHVLLSALCRPRAFSIFSVRSPMSASSQHSLSFHGRERPLAHPLPPLLSSALLLALRPFLLLPTFLPAFTRLRAPSLLALFLPAFARLRSCPRSRPPSRAFARLRSCPCSRPPSRAFVPAPVPARLRAPSRAFAPAWLL